MDDLLKDAIADAKAVRETALANAKMALEEAFDIEIPDEAAEGIATVGDAVKFIEEKKG